MHLTIDVRMAGCTCTYVSHTAKSENTQKNRSTDIRVLASASPKLETTRSRKACRTIVSNPARSLQWNVFICSQTLSPHTNWSQWCNCNFHWLARGAGTTPSTQNHLPWTYTLHAFHIKHYPLTPPHTHMTIPRTCAVYVLSTRAMLPRDRLRWYYICSSL